MSTDYLKASTEETERQGCNGDLDLGANACQGERGLVFGKSYSVRVPRVRFCWVPGFKQEVRTCSAFQSALIRLAQGVSRVDPKLKITTSMTYIINEPSHVRVKQCPPSEWFTTSTLCINRVQWHIPS